MIAKFFFLFFIKKLNYFKQKSLEKSPLLGQISKKKELAQQGIKVERSAYFPTLAATGTYNIINKDLSPYIPDYMVGIGLQWSLFDGNARSRKV